MTQSIPSYADKQTISFIDLMCSINEKLMSSNNHLAFGLGTWWLLVVVFAVIACILVYIIVKFCNRAVKHCCQCSERTPQRRRQTSGEQRYPCNRRLEEASMCSPELSLHLANQIAESASFLRTTLVSGQRSHSLTTPVMTRVRGDSDGMLAVTTRGHRCSHISLASAPPEYSEVVGNPIEMWPDGLPTYDSVAHITTV